MFLAFRVQGLGLQRLGVPYLGVFYLGEDDCASATLAVQPPWEVRKN